MLYEWLQRPHVSEWWGDPETPDEVHEYCALLTRPGSRDRAYVVMDGATPIGYIQSYAAKDSGAGWWPDEQDPGARGIDQFIAEANWLGRGVGSAMVRAFVDRLFEDPAVTVVQADPDPGNARAIRCYEKAGFVRVREVVTPDGPALLMIRRRVTTIQL